jgi:hypothetical protein
MRSLWVTWAFTAVVVLVTASVESIAQTSATSNEPQDGPAFVKLSPPVYPALARQAHITATAGKGHPLLTQSALDSAQQSQYKCRNCREPVTSYRLVYTYQLVDSSSDESKNQTYPQTIQLENHVTVVAQMVCLCDPPMTLGKVRSAKCLYLWKCASR